MSAPAAQPPTPVPFLSAIHGYQKTFALKSALDLDLFTVIGAGAGSAAAIAKACGASERGIRILCDFLTATGFLTKDDGRYGLSVDSKTFLDKTSPAYIGSSAEFFVSPTLLEGFVNLTKAVRSGGTAAAEEGTVAPDHPAWVAFARGLGPLMQLPAQAIAKVVDPKADRKLRILDLAAGHGVFGIALAKNNALAEIVAQDWSAVLEVAKKNAEDAGVAARFSTIPGSAFDVDWGSGYDLVLLTNFLHHFDPPTCETLLRKVHAALAPGGRAVTLEWVPNDDRVTPPDAAVFSLVMLATTPHGDAYTFAEYDAMFGRAGFAKSELHPLPMQRLIISQK
jgi:SAM-dependent methyltransferase